MVNKFVLIILLFCGCFTACKMGDSTSSETSKEIVKTDTVAAIIQDTLPRKQVDKPKELPENVREWVDIAEYAPSILQDIRYATDSNFVKQQIYDCGKCWLRAEAAKGLIRIHQQLQEQNLRVLVFDCYRPRPMQKRLWEVKPDPRYVTPPHKGSNHTRGIAVDLTIADSLGNALDMGTPFDFFGEKAWHTQKDLPEEVLENRKLLKETMENNGFKSIRTEWWHYSFITKTKHRLSDTLWTCK